MNILDDIINGPALFDDNIRLYERIYEMAHNNTSHAMSMGWMVGKFVELNPDEFDVSIDAHVIYKGFANYLNISRRMYMNRAMVTFFGNIPTHDIPWREEDFQSDIITQTNARPLAAPTFGKYAFLSELYRNVVQYHLQGHKLVNVNFCIKDLFHPKVNNYMVFARNMDIVQWSGQWSPSTILSLGSRYHNHVTASLYD